MAVFDCNNTSLRKGSQNDKVKTLQIALTNMGLYTGLCNGLFGDITKTAVRTFQRQNGLVVDGWFGKQSCKKFNEIVDAKKISTTEVTKKSTTNTAGGNGIEIVQFDCPNTSLKEGSSNTEGVKKLQTMLKELGYYTRQIDGDFGYYTNIAVKAFQGKTGHSADGHFGPKTCPDLNKIYASKMAAKALKSSASASTKNQGYVKPDYLKTMKYKLTLLPDVVVLPESSVDTSANSKTVTGGDISSTTNFDCTKISLKLGSKGEDVKSLQNVLKARGYYTRQVDGDFGSYTEKAVIQLQKAQGNDPDGWFGQKTCEKLQGTSSVSNLKKGQKYVIEDFSSIPSTSDDIDGLSHEVSLQTIFTKDKWKYMQKLQKTEFDMYLDDDLVYSHEGYISDLKISNQNDIMFIDISIVGYTVFLDAQLEMEEKTAKRSELLKEIIEMAGLKADIDTTGLDDSEYTLKIQKATTTTGSADTTGSGLTQLSGNDCTDTWSLSAYGNDIDTCKGNTKIGNSSANYATDTANMTAKEALLDVYRRFKYPSNGYPNNRYCPRSVWKKSGTISCNCADIARLVKCIGEVHGLKVGIKHVSNGSHGHYFNLIEINGKTYRFDCCFQSSGYVSSTYGGGLCNNLTKNGGPWQ